MGLEELREEILENAKKDAAAIMAEADKEAEEILKGSDLAAKEYEEKVSAETEKLLDAMEKKELASVELEIKKASMEAKREVIDAVFENAEKKLARLPKKDKEQVLSSLLKKAQKQLDVGTVYCNEADMAFFSKGKFKVEKADINQGIIVENTDGTVRLDFSYDEMLANIREKSLQSIGKLLF